MFFAYCEGPKNNKNDATINPDNINQFLLKSIKIVHEQIIMNKLREHLNKSCYIYILQINHILFNSFGSICWLYTIYIHHIFLFLYLDQMKNIANMKRLKILISSDIIFQT